MASMCWRHLAYARFKDSCRWTNATFLAMMLITDAEQMVIHVTVIVSITEVPIWAEVERSNMYLMICKEHLQESERS